MQKTKGKGQDFFNRVTLHYEKLSKKQQKLADYLRFNYKTAVFLTSVNLGKAAGSSEATVARLAIALGYSGFTDMIKSLRYLVEEELMPTKKFQSYEKEYTTETSNMIHNIIHSNVEQINLFNDKINQETVDWLVHKMKASKKTVLVGFEGNSGLVEILSYCLIRSGVTVEVINENTSDLFKTMGNLDKDIFAITIDFPPYVKRQVALTKKLHESGASILAITDSANSLLYKYCDRAVLMPIPNYQRFNIEIYPSLIILFQIIIYAYAFQNYDDAKAALNNYDKFLTDLDIIE